MVAAESVVVFGEVFVEVEPGAVTFDEVAEIKRKKLFQHATLLSR